MIVPRYTTQRSPPGHPIFHSESYACSQCSLQHRHSLTRMVFRVNGLNMTIFATTGKANTVLPFSCPTIAADRAPPPQRRRHYQRGRRGAPGGDRQARMGSSGSGNRHIRRIARAPCHCTHPARSALRTAAAPPARRVRACACGVRLWVRVCVRVRACARARTHARANVCKCE